MSASLARTMGMSPSSTPSQIQSPSSNSSTIRKQRSWTTSRNVMKASWKAYSVLHSRFVRDATSKLRDELEQVKAEANEFISSPLLLIRPMFLFAAFLGPLLIPFYFVPLSILCWLLVAFVCWYILCLGYIATEMSLRPPWYRFPGLPLHGNPSYWRHYVHDPKTDLGLEYEDVEFINRHLYLNRKNIVLRGWFLNHPNDQGRVVVCVHGAGRDRRAFLRHAAIFYQASYSVLLFDLSEHGLSDGCNRGFSFGVRESWDVEAAIEYVTCVRNKKSVVLVGTSTGASSSIIAAARRSSSGIFPNPICGLICENPFSRPADLFIHHAEDFLRNYLSQNRHHIWRRLLFWIFAHILLLRIGLVFNYGAQDAVSALQSMPILLMHSTADDVVPLEHCVRIYQAACFAGSTSTPRSRCKSKSELGFSAKSKAQPTETVTNSPLQSCELVSASVLAPAVSSPENKHAKLWIVSNADHCALYDCYPEEWKSRVLEFLDLLVINP